jgi:putative Mg2+ transporter-C (MgtC) family protein
MDDVEMFLRLAAATLAGLLLGLDREWRGIAAGIRTHALVSVSSAAITISALLLYAHLRSIDGNNNADPLRVIQGLAQAIGFIAAGTIFVSKGDVRNLTSAANIWLAAAVGIAAGAGQFLLVAMSVLFGLFILIVVRILEKFLPGSEKAQRD